MNIIEKCGGVAVMILAHRSEFEIETENMSKVLNDMNGPLEKLTSGTLRKSGDWRARTADMLAQMEELEKLVAEAHRISDRRRKAFPDFRASVLATGEPVRFAIAEKVFDSGGGGLVELWPRQSPPLDLTDAVGDTELRHRFQQRPNP